MLLLSVAHGRNFNRSLTCIVDMHMYITSALQKTDMKAVGLQLALELLHEKVLSQFKHCSINYLALIH